MTALIIATLLAAPPDGYSVTARTGDLIHHYVTDSNRHLTTVKFKEGPLFMVLYVADGVQTRYWPEKQTAVEEEVPWNWKPLLAREDRSGLQDVKIEDFDGKVEYELPEGTALTKLDGNLLVIGFTCSHLKRQQKALLVDAVEVAVTLPADTTVHLIPGKQEAIDEVMESQTYQEMHEVVEEAPPVETHYGKIVCVAVGFLLFIIAAALTSKRK